MNVREKCPAAELEGYTAAFDERFVGIRESGFLNYFARGFVGSSPGSGS